MRACVRACVRARQLASLRRGVLAVRPYLLYRHWAFHLALYELYEASHRHRAPLLLTPQHGRAAQVVAALIAAGVPADRVHAERFTSGPVVAAKAHTSNEKHAPEKSANKPIALTVVLDGKQHDIAVSADEHLLDAALEAGLDLPYACKGGVCCTCRAKLLDGEVTMDKNFTLEADEMAQGFVLSCQARALSASVKLSFDDR